MMTPRRNATKSKAQNKILGVLVFGVEQTVDNPTAIRGNRNYSMRSNARDKPL
jgi:hypothetical protein